MIRASVPSLESIPKAHWWLFRSGLPARVVIDLVQLKGCRETGFGLPMRSLALNSFWIIGCTHQHTSESPLYPSHHQKRSKTLTVITSASISLTPQASPLIPITCFSICTLCKYGARSKLCSSRISMCEMCSALTTAWTASGFEPGVAVSASTRKCGFLAIM